MGQQIGEAAREEIRAFSEVALDRVNMTVQCSREKALGVARNCFPYVETYAPHLLDEMRGMAEGSGIPVDDLMLLQVRNQLLGEHDCFFSIIPHTIFLYLFYIFLLSLPVLAAAPDIPFPSCLPTLSKFLTSSFPYLIKQLSLHTIVNYNFL